MFEPVDFLACLGIVNHGVAVVAPVNKRTAIGRISDPEVALWSLRRRPEGRYLAVGKRQPLAIAASGRKK